MDGDNQYHPVGELAALAVNAVDDVERRRLEHHLARCAACRDELDTLRQASALLSTDEEPVPDDLRRRVLAAVDEPRRRSWTRTRIAAAAACIVVAAGVGGAVWTTQRGDRPAVSHDHTMDQVLAAPDMRKASGAVGDGSVAAMYSPSHRATVVSVDGLPGVEPSMGYQVWITVGGAMKSAGVVSPGNSSSVVMTDMERPVDVGLSVEPMTGSSEPTSPMVVSFPIR
ncbi:anti-sigma factor [Gordonia sp. MP11Mi]|uniref:Regulator of SigK n=1 Tax=Gordonia sp. MP11Mi TaxID=3022769 RepID=A0AA97CTL2_9ACTN